MPITLTISGDNASDILRELETLSRALTKPKIEWRQVWSAESDVRMAAEVQSTNDPEPDRVAYDAPVAEEKPKRKRRTKEEMEAERAAGLPPQEGYPDLEPVTEVAADILDDDTPAVTQKQVYTRASVQERVAKIISQRSLTPAEIRNVFITYGGESTNAASMDEKFAEAVATALDRAVAEKGA